MKRIHNTGQVKNNKRGECLLGDVNFVSKTDTPSFETRELAWEASILPLNYTRADGYVSVVVIQCQMSLHYAPY